MRFDAAWRRQRREEHDASLDDLLLFEEDEAPATVPDPQPRRWIVRAALFAFAASAVVYTLFRVFDLAPPFPLVFAVCAGAVLVRRAVSQTTEPYHHRTRDLIRPRGPAVRIEPSGWFEGGGDSVIDGVRRWDRRLDWGATAPERFVGTVARRIGELADERLRQRHGITRPDDPARARRLLGERLWTLLHDEPRQVPSARDVAAAISTLEQL